jgi:Protein of unknown function (DUF1260).
VDEREIRESIAVHGARNRELLEFMRLNGEDADTPRTFNVFIYARDEHRARRLGIALLERSFKNLVVRPPEGFEDAWAVEGQVVVSVAEISGDEFTESIVRLTAAFDADYHGWQAAREPLPF